MTNKEQQGFPPRVWVAVDGHGYTDCYSEDELREADEWKAAHPLHHKHGGSDIRAFSVPYIPEELLAEAVREALIQGRIDAYRGQLVAAQNVDSPAVIYWQEQVDLFEEELQRMKAASTEGGKGGGDAT